MSTAEALNKEGNDAFHMDKIKEAIELYTKAIEQKLEAIYYSNGWRIITIKGKRCTRFIFDRSATNYIF